MEAKVQKTNIATARAEAESLEARLKEEEQLSLTLRAQNDELELKH